MAAKTTSRMKEARLILTRIVKLLAPLLLLAVIGMVLIPAVKFAYVTPLILFRHLTEIEEHTDPSSAMFAQLIQETRRAAGELLLVSIAVALVTLTLALAKPILGRFTASSTTNSVYSLAGLLREMTRWHNLRPALVTTAAVITVLQLASVALLVGNFATGMRGLGLLVSEPDSVFLDVFLVILGFLYVSVLALVGVALRWKKWYVVVLVALLLPTLLIPLCEVPLLYFYVRHISGVPDVHL